MFPAMRTQSTKHQENTASIPVQRYTFFPVLDVFKNKFISKNTQWEFGSATLMKQTEKKNFIKERYYKKLVNSSHYDELFESIILLNYLK